jgi:hypothetical protein
MLPTPGKSEPLFRQAVARAAVWRDLFFYFKSLQLPPASTKSEYDI